MKGARQSPGLRLRSDCARALAEIVEKKVTAPVALQRFVYEGPCAKDERDRALAKELVMGVLRWRGTLMKLLAAMSRRSFSPFQDDWSFMVMLLGMYQVLFMDRMPHYASVSSSVELLGSHSGKRVVTFANAVLRRCSRARSLDGLIASVAPGRKDEILWASYPRWLERKLRKVFGDGEAFRLAMTMNERPCASIRLDGIDGRKAGEKIMERFSGAKIKGGRWLPSCLAMEKGGDLASLDLHAEGHITVQNEGSQVVGHALAAGGSDAVFDACSGMGIKSGQIAGGLKAGGFIVAADRNPRKIRMLVREAKRLRTERIRPLCADSTALPFKAAGLFDRILVDAPCSGTGSLARKPEIKCRLRKSDPLRLAGFQEKILSGASRHLRKGGLIIYSVCSILPEEGIGVIRRFLQHNPDFILVRPPLLPQGLEPEGEENTVLLLPHIHGTEGFFIAALSK